MSFRSEIWKRNGGCGFSFLIFCLWLKLLFCLLFACDSEALLSKWSEPFSPVFKFGLCYMICLARANRRLSDLTQTEASKKCLCIFYFSFELPLSSWEPSAHLPQDERPQDRTWASQLRQTILDQPAPVNLPVDSGQVNDSWEPLRIVRNNKHFMF